MYRLKKTMTCTCCDICFFPPFSVKYYMIHTCKQHFDHVHGFSVGVSNVSVVVLGFELVISFRI